MGEADVAVAVAAAIKPSEAKARDFARAFRHGCPLERRVKSLALPKSMRSGDDHAQPVKMCRTYGARVASN